MQKIEFNNSNGQKIVGILESVSDNDEVVIIIHGFSANKDGGPRVMAGVMAEKGINSFRIDLDNQGESEPKLEDASISLYKDGVLAAIKQMKFRGYNKIDLLGTSFGGAVALAVANEFPINKMVLRAPVFDHYARMSKIYGGEGIKKAQDKGYFVYKKDEGQAYHIKFNWFDDAKLYPFDKLNKVTCPILVIHGDNDECVDVQDSIEMVPQFPNAKLVVINGASHHLGVNGDWSESLDAMTNFFK